MISFTEGKKVAVVCGGEYNNKYIYITQEKKEPDRTIDDEELLDILDDVDFKQGAYKQYNQRDRLKLEKALKQRVEPLDEYLIAQYQKMQNKLNEKLKKDLELPNGQMIPVPDEMTERIYVAGKTGSGKSSFAALYASEFNRKFPKKKIYIFTKHEKEKAYQSVPHIEITFDNEILQNPVDITSLSNSLVIFDDCDNIQDKVIAKNVKKLNDDIITAGRKYGIYCLTTGHLLMNYKETRSLLNECSSTVFFSSVSNYHIVRYLKVYMGLTSDVIKKITGIKSRWVSISSSFPSYVLHEHGIFII